MIIAALQPSFMPWLGYFEQMERADLFVYLDDVQYTKQDWRNRNRFKAGNGRIEYLTVPIRAEHAAVRIADVRTADGPWRGKIVNRLEAWYRKAPFFDDYFPQLRNELLREGELLTDLDVRLTSLLARFMDIDTPIAFSSTVPDKSAEKNQKLIDICRHFGADLLYDGAAAASFIDLDRFRASGIDVVFQDYQPVAYPQVGGGDFLSHLSALDTLFSCGERTRQIMLDGGAESLSRGLARLERRRKPCPICDAVDWKPFLNTSSGRCLSGDRTILPHGLQKVICESCGVVSNAVFGGITTLKAYEGGYRLNSTPGEEHVYFVKEGPIARSQAFLNWIVRHLDKDPASILEVGCGQGNLLQRLSDRFSGIRIQGLEGSREAAAIARNRGLDVRQGLVGRAGAALQTADLVVNILVLEHVEDPLPYLEALRRACAEDGRAIFVVPLQDLGGYDLFFDEHVWHFQTPHFRALLERAGWEVIAVDGADPVVLGLGLALCRPAGARPPCVERPRFADHASAQQQNRDVWLRRFEGMNREIAALGDQPVIVFGSGEVFSLLLAYTDLGRANLIACLDEDAGKIGGKVHHIDVHGLDWLERAPPAAILVTVNPRYYDKIREKLAAFGRPLIFMEDRW